MLPAEPAGVAEAAADDPPLGARQPLDAPQAGVLQVLHKLVAGKPGVVQRAVEPLVQAPPPHLGRARESGGEERQDGKEKRRQESKKVPESIVVWIEGS